MKWWMPDNGTAAVGIHNEAGKWLSDAAYRVDADRLVAAHNADIDALTAERDELQRRLDAVLDRLPEGSVWCYDCNRATVPVRCESFYEHIPREYKQMKTTFHCPICKRETYAKDSCVDSLRAIAEGREA
jgi:uncharacterized protein with PIN domain